MKVSENDWEYHYVSAITSMFVCFSMVYFAPAIEAMNVEETFHFKADTDFALCFLTRYN